MIPPDKNKKNRKKFFYIKITEGAELFQQSDRLKVYEYRPYKEYGKVILKIIVETITP